ncbi:hypothetical protein AB4379_12225 [Vibrio breoganii]
MDLNKKKKAELIAMYEVMEKKHNQLIDDYNLMVYLLEEEHKKTGMALGGLVNQLVTATKFKGDIKEASDINKLVKHIKKSSKRWK